jgi:hypothetical protein
MLLAVAQVCNPPYGEYGYAYNVSSQATLDQLAQECTVVNGSIVIANNCTESFYLPNIQNITGLIRSDADTSLLEATPTSINLPDLEHLDDSMYFDFATVTNVSVPKLKTAWEVEIEFAQKVDLSSLEDVEYLVLSGNLSR